MTDIRDWANEADLNGEASPAGWPEGMPPSDVNNSAREMMAALRRSYVRQPWYAPGGEIVRVGDNKITIKDDAKVNNYTQYYTVGQRVRVDGAEYSTTGFVSSILYEEPTSTIEFEFDAELPLPPTINEVYVGLNYQDVQGVAGPNLLGCIIGFTDDSSKLGAGLLHANGEKFSPSLYPDLAKLYLLGTDSDGSPIYRYGREKVGDVWWPKRPDVRGYFPRFLDDRGLPADGEEDSRVDTDAPRTVGDFQGDTVKNVKGRFPSGDENTAVTEGGPFYRLDEDYGWSGVKSSKSRKGIGFDLSLAIPTSDETRPKNIAVVGVIVAYGGVLAGGLADVSELVEDVKQSKALSERVLEEIDTLDDVMNYNGSVEMYSDLPTENNDVGDVYKVLETGTKYVWTSEGLWEELGSPLPSNVLLNNDEEGDSLVIGNSATAAGTFNTVIGTESIGDSESVAIGSKAAAYRFSTAVGTHAESTGVRSVALGREAKALAVYATQIGFGTNNEASTLKVGLGLDLNVKLLDSDGKIPVERLPEGIGGDVDLTGYLQDTATAENALTIAGTPLTQTNGMNIGPGSATWLYGLAVGVNANSSNANSCTAIGNNSVASANGSLAVGNTAKATAGNAIQIGKGTNNTANTMNVGLSSTLNVQLLDANGQIPAERLTNVLGDIETLLAAL